MEVGDSDSDTCVDLKNSSFQDKVTNSGVWCAWGIITYYVPERKQGT